MQPETQRTHPPTCMQQNSTHCKHTHHKQRNQQCSLPSLLPAGEIQQIQLGFCSLKRELRNSELQKRLEEQMSTTHVVTTLAHGRHFSCTKKTTTLEHQRQRRPQSSSGSSPCLCSYPPTYSSRRYLPYLLPLGQLCIGIPSFFLLLPTALV